MFLGRAGRAFAVAVRAQSCATLAVLTYGASSFAEAQQAATPVEPATSARAPGPAFHIDLRSGFDQSTQYISDFSVDNEHTLAHFRTDNVVFGERGMNLHARRDATVAGSYTVAEFMRRGFYGYGRYEVVMRATDADGAVTAFFTHTSEMFGDPHMEIDFEIVGRKPSQLHLNYFTNGKDDPQNVELSFDASKAEHLYAVEWLPGSLTWYVDGVKVREVQASSSPIGIPTRPGRVIANILTGARATEEWLGAPGFEDAASLISCISHVPIDQTGTQCSESFIAPSR